MFNYDGKSLLTRFDVFLLENKSAKQQLHALAVV